MEKTRKIILITAASIFCLLLIFSIYVGWQFSAPERNAPLDHVVMNLNTSDAQFISLLKQQGYIRSIWAFDTVLKFKHWTGDIDPGAYMVSKSMNAAELADQFVNHPVEKWVVIPEGLRDEEIADKMQQVLNWTAAQKTDFLNASKEGYMFPDTYLINPTDAGASVALKMENQFNEETATLFKEAATANIRNDTMVILASLIQREAANEKEMPLIAEIIWNRLNANMPLQIDASIQYALGKEGDWWGTVGRSDYAIDSPYNLYTNIGKPPAPICNPGLAAMNAIVNPDMGSYLYYLHDTNGQIHVATTYAEHLANIKIYLQNN